MATKPRSTPAPRRRTRALHGFHIRVSRHSRLRVHVLVFRTYGDLREAVREVSRGQSVDSMLAFCRSAGPKQWVRYTPGGPEYPVVATIGLALPIRPRFVVHEAFHCALRYGARVGYRTLPLPRPREEAKYDFAREERLARVCDEVYRAIVAKLFDLKVWT